MDGKDKRSVTYALDHPPYSVNYTIKDMGMGRVQFQHNLYATADDKEHLLERIYFTADSLETLRELMYQENTSKRMILHLNLFSIRQWDKQSRLDKHTFYTSQAAHLFRSAACIARIYND